MLIYSFQNVKIYAVYEENDGNEEAIRAVLDRKVIEYKEWFRSPHHTSEKRTAVEQKVEGTKRLLKRAT